MAKTSKYKGVGLYTIDGVLKWKAFYMVSKTSMWQKICSSEREAAIAYDKKMLELGKQPVNILKPKTKTNRANIGA